MGFVIVLIVAIVEAGLAAGLLWVLMSKRMKSAGGGVEIYQAELDKRKGMEANLITLLSSMVEISKLAEKAAAIKQIQESLKAERGRITITQAELETVETRLRELDEIERELEASALETKEEIKILKRKEGDLSNKNQQLKQQIDVTKENVVKILKDVQMSSEMQDQVRQMETNLLATEMKIDNLLASIEQGNEQYFILKSRYDALDIEYAQLYEKFAEAESAGDKDKDKDKE